MSDKNEIDALNTCLELLDQGLAIEVCLARYPEAAAQLEPMLRLAMEARRLGETIEIPADAQRNGIGRITEAWVKSQVKNRSQWWRVARPLAKSWALAMIAVVILGFGGWTTSTVAADSVPGEVLYPVKKAQESVLLVVTFTDRRKAELHAKFAHQRTQEIAKLVDRGKSQAAMDRTADRMAHHTRRVVMLMGGELQLPKPLVTDPLQISQEELAIRVTLVPVSGLITLSQNKRSRERYRMQERFLQQFHHFQKMEERISRERQSLRRARMEESFYRSQEFFHRAILAMKAIEEAEAR